MLEFAGFEHAILGAAFEMAPVGEGDRELARHPGTIDLWHRHQPTDSGHYLLSEGFLAMAAFPTILYSGRRACSFRGGSRKARLLPASSFGFVDSSFDKFTETRELILVR